MNSNVQYERRINNYMKYYLHCVSKNILDIIF